jgi:hypothetical protein
LRFPKAAAVAEPETRQPRGAPAGQ